MSFPPDLLLYLGTENYEESRFIFSNLVHDVVIESSSFCNRKCFYCPNSIHDRMSEKKYLNDDAIYGVIDSLATIEYARRIQLGYFNEPLADERIVDIVAAIKSKLPKVCLSIFTNGDYLDQSLLGALGGAGLDEICISLHIGNEKLWNDADVARRYEDVVRRIGVNVPVSEFISGARILGEVDAGGMRVMLRQLNYQTHGYDRGGSLTTVEAPHERDEPCFSPFRQIFIGFNGMIFPCCNIHPDLPTHSGYSVGALSDYPDIFRAFAGRRYAAWRRELGVYGAKRPPCRTCTMSYLLADEVKQKSHEVTTAMSSVALAVLAKEAEGDGV